jgi:hypothetical protein
MRGARRLGVSGEGGVSPGASSAGMRREVNEPAGIFRRIPRTCLSAGGHPAFPYAPCDDSIKGRSICDSAWYDDRTSGPDSQCSNPFA